jgi:hypothetical protein
MSTTTQQLSNKLSNVGRRGDAIGTKLPHPIRFPLIVILSLASSSLLYSFAAEYTAGDLASVSRSLNEWWEVGALLGWRT